MSSSGGVTAPIVNQHNISAFFHDLWHGIFGGGTPSNSQKSSSAPSGKHQSNSAPSGQQSQAPGPSVHPTAIIVIFGGAVAIALGGTQLGPLINLSLVAVIVYELTLYKPPAPPQMA